MGLEAESLVLLTSWVLGLAPLVSQAYWGGGVAALNINQNFNGSVGLVVFN